MTTDAVDAVPAVLLDGGPMDQWVIRAPQDQRTFTPLVQGVGGWRVQVHPDGRYHRSWGSAPFVWRARA